MSTRRSKSRAQMRIREGTLNPPEQVQRASARAKFKYAFEPAKQYVREEGWLAAASRYVSDMRAAGISRPVKYFTLPGDEAIDIGVLYKAGIIQPENGKWKNVAICDKTSAATVRNNLGELGALSDERLDIALGKHKGGLIEFFPVDIINLDFYSGWLITAPDERSTMQNINTLQRILSLQRGQRLLVFITHRIALQDYSGENRDIFDTLIKDNLQNEEFRGCYREVYGGDDSSLCMKDLAKFGMIAVPKIIAHIANDAGYQIKETFAGRYSHEEKRYWIASHNILFRPLGRASNSAEYLPRSGERRASHPTLRVVSPRIREAVHRVNGDFVRGILRREATDVSKLLNSEKGLMDRMRASVSAFAGWWSALNSPGK